MRTNLNRIFNLKIIVYGFLIYFIYLLTLITVQYIPINYEVAFLNLKIEEIKLPIYRVAFFSHVYSSLFIIMLGLTQFSDTIRRKFCFIHQTIGKVYVVLILLIASPSGLVMAYFANGGITSKISFAILSVLWFVLTYKAYLFIKKKDFENHRDFMIRSYALTLSAISLRLFKFVIVTTFELPPMDTYRMVSVLGWTVNLLIAEIIIKEIHTSNIARLTK